MKYVKILAAYFLATLHSGAPVLAAPKALLVASYDTNFVAQGLKALGVDCHRIAPRKYPRTNPFDYDLILWGFDESRNVLYARPGSLHAFLRAGGVFLGFRTNGPDEWLRVPALHDKAYHLGKILKPDHPVFSSPHSMTLSALREVHGGSIYRAFYGLGKGWTPLVSTGPEQEWDKTKAREQGEHYGLIELQVGRGRVLLCQMIPAYHWFHDKGGDRDSAGAKFFENLVRYAVRQAPELAADRPPRKVPDGFHPGLSAVLALPRRGDGLPLDSAEWLFSSKGPYSKKTDRRGVLTFTHADVPSRAGSFAEVSRTIQLPRDSQSLALRWYETDTYCGGRERVLGGKEHGRVAYENYKKGMRFARVLVNDKPVWEQDVLGRNPHPGRLAFHTADISSLVGDADASCTVALRVEDRVGSKERPFAIDVFFATVEVIADFRRIPAASAFHRKGFEIAEEGRVRLAGKTGVLTASHSGAKGKYAIALHLLDEHVGQSRVRLFSGSKLAASWILSADDHRDYWAVSPAVILAPGEQIRIEAGQDGSERVEISELAVIPARLLARPEPPRPRPRKQDPESRTVKFNVTVPETAGLARENEIASQGLPFPRGCLTDPVRVRLTTDAGNPVPVQERVIARWPDRSIKMCLVSFPVSVKGSQTAVYKLETGKKSSAASGAPLRLTEEGGDIRIDTGVIQLTVSAATGGIVGRVSREGRIVKKAGELWELELVTEEGRILRSGGSTATDTRIVDRGPLRTLVVKKGKLSDDKGRVIDYRVQLEACAGSDFLRCQVTIINREDAPEVLLKRWSLSLQLAGGEKGRVWLSQDESLPANSGAVLFQHREDRLTWTGKAGPRKRVKGRAPGLIGMPGLAVGLRWFWQRYPQAIRFTDGAVRFDFIPEAFDGEDLPTRWRDRLLKMTTRYSLGGVGYPQSPGKMGLFRLARGEALSQEVGFLFHGADGADRVPAELAARLTAPLRAVPDAAYTASTGAFGELFPADPLKFKAYEASVERARLGYLAKREKRREYGFENFGDQTFEWGYGPSYTFWSNSEYDHHHGFALQYLRSGDPQWWTLCEETARHYRDVVVIHHALRGSGRFGGPHHHNATTVWMPQDKEQFWIADHTMHGPSAGHSWVEGMIDYWYLTGDPWAEEVVHEMEDWYCTIAETNRYGAGGQERGPGWALIALSALARATGSERVLKAGESVARWIEEWQDPIRGVISVPISEQPSYEGGSTFMHGIVGRGLGRWYDVTGNPRTREALIGIAEWISTEPMGRPGTFWYKQSPNNSKRYGATDQCLTALTYAYRETGDPWFGQISKALLSMTGANVRSMNWYPQSLAHLSPLFTPAEISLKQVPLVTSPDSPAKAILLIRNTTRKRLSVSVSGKLDGPFTIELPGRIKLPPQGTQELSVIVKATGAPASGQARIDIEFSPPQGPVARRSITFQARAVKKLVRLKALASEFRLTVPMVLTGRGPSAYAHTPRTASFLKRPRPEDGTSGGYLIWSFNLPLDADVVLQAELQWIDDAGNSFFLSVDGGKEILFGNSGPIGSWFWLKGPALRLTKGVHKVKVRTREDGSKIRQLSLTSTSTGSP